MSDRGVLDVWVGGIYAGQLHRRDADVDFAYDAQYRAGRTPALSVSMPKSRVHHSGNVAGRWIDNLLPDNDEVRQRWAAHFGAVRADAFSLLHHTGADCAGAVQIFPTGTSPETETGSDPFDEDMIEKRLRELRRDPAQWNFADHGGRWSLGGAQGKFALAQRSDGSWESPTGRSASTHIFKVGVPSLRNGDVLEYVTMRAADILEIPVATTVLRKFGRETAMVSQRFDRHIDADGNAQRVHQEDMCQALGMSRVLKYESEGGPSVSDISDVMRNAVDPRDLEWSRKLFARALIFNWITVGTDAHAKNYALLHAGSRVRMAPLYDLTGIALNEEPDDAHFRSKLAMKMGGSYRVRDVTTSSLERTATAVGTDASWMLNTADEYITRMPDAVAQAVDEASDVIPRELAERMKGCTSERAGRARRAVRSTSPTDSPLLSGSTTAGVDGNNDNDNDVTVSEHVRGGRTVRGYSRKRPGNS